MSDDQFGGMLCLAIGIFCLVAVLAPHANVIRDGMEYLVIFCGAILVPIGLFLLTK